MPLQYLDALKAIGAGPSTKFIFPLEFTNLAQSFADRLTPADVASNGVEPKNETVEAL